MEHRRANTFAFAQDLLQLQRGGRFGADDQHFLRTVAGEMAHQPLNARVEVPPGAGIAFKLLINLLRIEHIAGALFGGFTGAHNPGNLDSRLVLGRQRQANRVQLAFREAFHAVTRVAEQYATGAVTVHQHGDQLLARGLGIIAVAVGRLQERFDILFADQIAQRVQLGVVQLIPGQQQGDGVGNRTVVLLLFNKLSEIMETVRVEQAQAGEVALHPELFRRRGEQQNARHALGQLFNSLIFAAWRVFAPHQMVRFIDDHQVPFGIAQVLQALLAAAHEVQRADNQLFGFERVNGVVLRFGVALIVKQRKAQVKAAQHFHQPLVLQSFRNDDQNAFGSAGEQLLMQDHPGFNGFT